MYTISLPHPTAVHNFIIVIPNWRRKVLTIVESVQMSTLLPVAAQNKFSYY